MSERFDLIVIGAGSGGLTAGRFASQLGVKVALVEKHRIGGDCTWTGCVPSKALLHVAKVAHMIRTASTLGINAGNPTIKMAQVHDHIQQVIQEIYQHESLEQLEAEGIEVVMGGAKFLDSHTIQVGDRQLQGKKFIISTGATPVVPPINGLTNLPYFTHEHIFDNERLPAHLLIIGAGAIGCELGQAYRRLGAQVTLIDVQLLPAFDSAVGDVVEQVFQREGIQFVAGLVSQVQKQGDEIFLTVGDEIVQGDMLLVATGRKPNTIGLDLENAGIVYSPKGIHVNDRLQTTAPHIYAVGDCIGREQSTHYAGWMAVKAVRNALLPGGSAGSTDFVPLVVFTDPEVAQVGLTIDSAREKFGEQVKVAQIEMKHTDRAVTDRAIDGFVQIVHKAGGKLLGATIVSARAGEMINEMTLALEQGLKVRDLSWAMHAYPTYGISTQILAGNQTMVGMLAGNRGKLLRYLAKR